MAHSYAVRLMQHLAVPTFVIDPNRRVVIWNRACERLTGVAAAEVLDVAGFIAAKRGAPHSAALRPRNPHRLTTAVAARPYMRATR